MTEPTPDPTPTPTPAGAPDPNPADTGPDAGKRPPWGDPENFTPEKAWDLIKNLRDEVRRNPSGDQNTQKLQQELTSLRTAQQERDKALAAALGLAETPKSEDLAETVTKLQKQIADDRHDALRARLAAENHIDDDHMDLLTETDPEKLKAQAEKVGALIAAHAPQGPTAPAFQPNPGQGRGGNPDPAAAEAAEYEHFYPTTPNRK